jgi:hypothetical protein
MATCPVCGALVEDSASFCARCGSPLQPLQQQPVVPPTPSQPGPRPSAPTYQPPLMSPPLRTAPRSYAIFGYVSAVLSLFFIPEIFGPAAILLGAYLWRMERGSRGLNIVILGIVCMLIGIYFTALFALIDLVPLS